jgi:hypothetical protein
MAGRHEQTTTGGRVTRADLAGPDAGRYDDCEIGTGGPEAGFVPIAGEGTLEGIDGGGPFTSRLVWRLSDGQQATWESRPARRLGAIKIRTAPGEPATTLRPPPEIATRLRRVNRVAAGAFTVGGSLFALGAVVAQLGSGSPTTAASLYFAGGIFFSTGGYASLLGAINAPRSVGAGGVPAADSWRWWSYEPRRIDWLSTFLLFAGTLAFGISLVSAFLKGLTTQQENRLIWSPEMIGCILFLVSGHFAMTEICHRFRPCLRRRDLGWAIVAINQIGSTLFMISALAAFTRPVTGSAVNVDVSNWGTLTGALCFAIGGVMQAFDMPPRRPAKADPHFTRSG